MTARADYQVLSFSDSATLTRVGIWSSAPLTLEITGEEFRAVSEVRINGVASPEFVVVSSGRVLAEVPRSERTSRLRRVQVLLHRKNLTPTSAIAFRSVVPGGRATGFTRMLQSFLRVLFTNPGEDLHDQQLGAGLSGLVGSAGSPGEMHSVAAAAIAEAETQMVRFQARSSSLAPAETLQSAALISAKFDPLATGLRLHIRLTAMDGSTGNPVLSV